MNMLWKELKLPDFGTPEEAPIIPVEVLEARCRKAYAAAGCEWLAVYGDREHYANLDYLVGFDPRFEEALLLIGRNEQKYLLVGNEGFEYASLVKVDVSVVLCQTFSLMGQDRSRSASLNTLLEEAGLARGQQVAICGWKYFEGDDHAWNCHVPAFIVQALSHVLGGVEGIVDRTSVLMHPTDGLRVRNEAAQIARNEWAAARASSALLRVVRATEPGVSELDIVSSMAYAGEPMSAHVMYSAGQETIVGLRSPLARKLEQGDGIFTAIGYWGGLSARGGLADHDNPSYLDKWALPYYRGIAAWYQTAAIGVTGGEVYARVCEELAKGGLRPALNPGHSIGADEWVHSFFTAGNQQKIASGMAIQCDIIPTPMAEGIVLNCEDSVVFADEALRQELATQYPEVWARIQARQRFVREEIGIAISDDLLPISNTPAYYTPLFLAPDHAITLA